MGSGAYSSYKGTHGSKLKQNHSCSRMHHYLSHWSKRQVKKLENISKRQRDRFKTACVVYDITTGKRYYGRNHGIDISKEPKNPILFGNANQKGLLPTKSLNHLEVGNCAEVQAVNRALNHGAKLKNLYMITIDTTKHSMGKLKPGCLNCKYTFNGRVKINYSGWEQDKKGDDK